MSNGVHEQWTSKGTISASPSLSKISWAKGRSPGWAAFGLTQQGKQGLEPEFDIDPYLPVQNNFTSMPRLQNSVMSNGPSLRSFSSVVQPSRESPALVWNGNSSHGQTIVGDASSKSGNKAETKYGTNPSLEKLKELHCWADEELIEDILRAVNNDSDQAFTLLKHMELSGSSEQTKMKTCAEQGSLFQNFTTDKKNVQADEGVASYNVTYIAELRSALDECTLNTRMVRTSENIPDEFKLSDATTHVQINSRHIIAAPAEPEWEEDDVYMIHRKDAIRAMRSASQHSRAASNAFMRGDRISAQKLSLKAREEWIVAEKLNAKAAEEILSIRNRGNDIWKLDLHGLHASEAVRALQDHLWKIENHISLNRSVSPNSIGKPLAGIISSSLESVNSLGMVSKTEKEQGISWQRPAVLQVITGAGNHSRGQAALPMAVRSFLVENGYRFDEGRPGVVDVRTKFRRKQTGENAQISNSLSFANLK